MTTGLPAGPKSGPESLDPGPLGVTRTVVVQEAREGQRLDIRRKERRWPAATCYPSRTGGSASTGPRPRHFTDEFKRQIVDLHNAGKPRREAMDEYDLGKSTVERRVKPINATGSPRAADNRTPEQNRILELERENRRLRMEVDILRRAAPVYARK